MARSKNLKQAGMDELTPLSEEERLKERIDHHEYKASFPLIGRITEALHLDLAQCYRNRLEELYQAEHSECDCLPDRDPCALCFASLEEKETIF